MSDTREPGHYQDAAGRHWLHQVYDGSAYGAPDRDTDQWIDPWGQVMEPPADLVRLLPADRRVAPDRETLDPIRREVKAMMHHLNGMLDSLDDSIIPDEEVREQVYATIRDRFQEANRIENALASLPLGVLGIPADLEPWRAFDPESGDERRTATREQGEAYLRSWPNTVIMFEPRGIPADQRTADRETIERALIEAERGAMTDDEWAVLAPQITDESRHRKYADAVLAVLVPADLIRAEGIEHVIAHGERLQLSPGTIRALDRIAAEYRKAAGA